MWQFLNCLRFYPDQNPCHPNFSRLLPTALARHLTGLLMQAQQAWLHHLQHLQEPARRLLFLPEHRLQAARPLGWWC